jgi:hypothetical protein
MAGPLTPSAADPPGAGRIVVADPAGVVVASWSLPADQTGLAAVDRLCRLQLLARRQGWTVVLHDPSVDLRAVLELAGLAEVVGVVESPAGSVEPVGQIEVGEEGRLEEVVEADDPPV